MREPSPAILDRLRSETRLEHEAIEAVLALHGSRLTPATYLRRLEQFHGFYRPVEQRLRAVAGWTAWGIDLEPRRKTPLLEADLTALGVATEGGPPAASDLPQLADLAAGFGCLYVLEGATLGGRVISRRVRATLGVTPETGGRFFHGYGERTGAMWQSFRVALAAFAAVPDTHGPIVAAAGATFRALHACCEGTPHA